MHRATVLGAAAAEHDRPHDPQLFTSIANSTSQPLPAIASQLPNPAVQADSPQLPAAHVAAAFARAHVCPHALQCNKLVRVSVSHPLDASPSQLPKPEVHAPITHEPVEQVPVA